MTQYKRIELITYTIFITGFLLWKELNIPWNFFKSSQLTHFILSILLTLVFLIPFIVSHMNKHKKTILKSQKTFKKRRQTFLGILIFILLSLLILSGGYLFLVGNRGGDIYGSLSNIIHFYGSFIFILLVIYHSYYLGRKGLKEDKRRLHKIIQH